jgi:hypothetical protein
MSTVGTITLDGVTSSSNTMTADQMRESLGVTEPAETSEAPAETPAPDTSEQPAPETPEPPPVATRTEPAPKAKLDPTKDPATRIAKATYEREQAKRDAQAEIQRVRDEHSRELAALRAELDALKPQRPTEQPKADGDPTFDQLLEKHKDKPDPYAAAIREQALNDVRSELTTREKQQAEAREHQRVEYARQQREQAEQARLGAFHQKMAQAFTANPDLQMQIEASELELTRPMGDAIIESDAPEKLVAYLIANPEENARILAMDSPLKQFRALARLDASLESPASPGHSGQPVPKKTAAHAPISPVGGGHAAPNSGPPDPKTCTQEEYDAYWNKQEREARMAGARR